jgi:hypothetical protein
MAPSESTGLTFYNQDHCYWRNPEGGWQFVRVVRWCVAPDGKIMVVVREIGRPFNGVALVPEEELSEEGL